MNASVVQNVNLAPMSVEEMESVIGGEQQPQAKLPTVSIPACGLATVTVSSCATITVKK